MRSGIREETVSTILFKGGTLIDGTGAEPRPGNVLVRDEVIAAVGRFAAPVDVQVIDCSGLAVAPAFIDSHSHSDLQVLESRQEKVEQGVTAEVVGNCGFSPRGPLLRAPFRWSAMAACESPAWEISSDRFRRPMWTGWSRSSRSPCPKAPVVSRPA
jgi:hypothetical protein